MLNRRKFLSTASASLAGAVGTAAWTEAALADPENPARRYHVVDTHFHLFNTALQDREGIPRALDLDATVEAGVAALRRGGVDKAFLISYNAQDIAPQFRQRNIDPARLRLVYNTQYQIAAWKQYPDVFYWVADHVDPLRETYLEDLERDLDAGASAIKLLPIFKGFLPDHPGFLPVYEICRKRKKPVILDISYWYLTFMPPINEVPARRGLVKQYADYVKLLEPIFREYQQVSFSLAHCGTARAVEDYEQIFPLIANHPNVSCDVAAATGYSADFIQRLVKEVGARKVMYGTDWPYWSIGPESFLKGARRWTMIADECPSLTEDDKRLIFGENADRFLKNELPGIAPGAPRPFPATGTGRAARIHKDSLVIVIHDHNPIGPDLEKMLSGGVTGKVYNLTVDVEIGPDFRASATHRDGWRQKGLDAIREVERTIAADPKRLMLARKADDFVKAKQEGKVAILLGAEGAKLLEGKIETLQEFYDLGLRELQLRWAVPNQLVEQDNLTAFGVQVVRECQRLGIIVDLTHIPSRAFDDAIGLLEKPPIVSHGTAAGVRTDLDDRRIKAIAARRGVIGLHFYSSYLGPKPTISNVIDNVDYITKLVGIDAVGLGVDFFPTQGKWGEFQRSQGTKEITWAIEHIGQMSQVTDALVARGYSDDEIGKILGGNFLRVCREALNG